MKKAFKSSTIQDQQVVSKNSIPNPVADIYNQSDKPPPLNILTPYRYGSLTLPTASTMELDRRFGRGKMCWCAGWDHLRGLFGLQKNILKTVNGGIIPNEMSHCYRTVGVCNCKVYTRSVSSGFHTQTWLSSAEVALCAASQVWVRHSLCSQ